MRLSAAPAGEEKARRTASSLKPFSASALPPLKLALREALPRGAPRRSRRRGRRGRGAGDRRADSRATGAAGALELDAAGPRRPPAGRAGRDRAGGDAVGGNTAGSAGRAREGRERDFAIGAEWRINASRRIVDPRSRLLHWGEQK